MCNDRYEDIQQLVRELRLEGITEGRRLQALEQAGGRVDE
jgi:hypothetical protein